MTRPIYVFDLDGVITDPADSQVDERVVASMQQLLHAGKYLAVNTGRSFEWVEVNLISRLLSDQPERLFHAFIVVCEKGGETVRRQDGKWVTQPSQFALPTEPYQRAQTVFLGLQGQLASMFWDSTKRTMATIEKYPKADLATFHAEQQLLVRALTSELSEYDVRIDATTIATDIESLTAGKYAGAALIYEWSQAEAHESEYICIGDSVSDYEMARYFAEQSLATTFVYVGKGTDKIVQHDDVAFVATNSQYAVGTREYLATVRNG